MLLKAPSKIQTLILMIGSLAMAASDITIHPDITALSVAGGITVIEGVPGNYARNLYYQDSTTGAINEILMVDFFNKAGASLVRQMVPAAEVLPGSPIAGIMIGNASSYQVHIYFFSPSGVLSEYYSTNIWNGGSGCKTCLTANEIIAIPGSPLYATHNPSNNTIAVGFVNCASPNTLTEAIKSTNSSGAWGLWGFYPLG